MDLNEKTIAEIASQLGLAGNRTTDHYYDRSTSNQHRQTNNRGLDRQPRQPGKRGEAGTQRIASSSNSQNILNQLGVSKKDIDYLSSKSDAELEHELLKLKAQLKANNVSYETQMAMIRSLAPMLDPKQRARLNKVVEILRK